MSELRNTILELRKRWYDIPDYKKTFEKHGHGPGKYSNFYLDKSTFEYIKFTIKKVNLLEKAQLEKQDRLIKEINLMFDSRHDQYYFGEFVWACLDYLQEIDCHL